MIRERINKFLIHRKKEIIIKLKEERHHHELMVGWVHDKIRDAEFELRELEGKAIEEPELGKVIQYSKEEDLKKISREIFGD